MKKFLSLLALLASAAIAAEPTGFDIKVNNVPPDAIEVVALVDTAAPPPAGYDDVAAPVAPPPNLVAAAEPPAAAGAAEPQRRRRRAVLAATAAPTLASAVRASVAPNGQSSVALRAEVPAGDKYQIRVVALRGAGASPVVLAGGRVAQAKTEAEKIAPVEISLATPTLKLAPANPTTVAPGASYTLAGTITDAANCLGAKNRLRVWLNRGTPPRENFSGTQVSTIDVTTEGDDVKFSFTLTAPKEPGPLYFQFGEVPGDFARADGRQAPLLVLPDLSAGAAPLALRVE